MAHSAPSAVLDVRTQASGHDIVVIGASAGGTEALTALLKQLPEDLPAAIFVAYHMPANAQGALVQMLSAAHTLRVKRARDQEEIRNGIVYVAPPDRHLLVKRGRMRITHGPRENRWRPSIDALFRSAAVSYGSRVVGIVLTGMLDDGTAGLLAIKRCGGVTMVQDPADAEYPDMPQSALVNVEIDFRLGIADMGRAIAQIAVQPAGESPAIPRELETEVRISESGRTGLAGRESPDRGRETGLSCPECGGPLGESFKEGFPVYRCLVGHGWAPQTLIASSAETLEATLWAAIRLFRQRSHLFSKMGDRESRMGRERAAQSYRQLASEAMEHGTRLQEWVVNAVDTPEPP